MATGAAQGPARAAAGAAGMSSPAERRVQAAVAALAGRYARRQRESSVQKHMCGEGDGGGGGTSSREGRVQGPADVCASGAVDMPCRIAPPRAGLGGECRVCGARRRATLSKRVCVGQEAGDSAAACPLAHDLLEVLGGQLLRGGTLCGVCASVRGQLRQRATQLLLFALSSICTRHAWARFPIRRQVNSASHHPPSLLSLSFPTFCIVPTLRYMMPHAAPPL